MEAPIENQIHRRKFIKGIFITALIAGLNPLDTISACELNSGDDLLAILADAKAEYQKFMRQISNSNKLDTLSQEEARIQDVGLLKLIAVGSDKDFPKYSREKKINKLKDAKAFQPKNKVSESERQKIMRELMFSAEMTFDASAFAYVGTTAIVGSTIKVLNLINPAYKVILTVPRWAKITHAIMGGLVAIRRGWNEFESRARSSSASSAEVLKSSIYDKYLSSSDFKFETKIPNFKYTVSNTDLKPNDAFRDSDFKDPDLKEVMLWMRDRLSQTDIFANKKELESFLDGYLDKIGKIQEESIKNVLDAYKKADEVALSKQRDKAALFDSIQNFVGNAILSNVAAPKEAAILNTLMGVGFQLAMGASFGPVGIAAVGINIATTLFSKNSNGGFEAAVFKALKQIQEQLTIISDKIDVLHRNQIQIINQLNQILSKLEKIEDLVTDQFREISTKQDLIYNTILTAGKQTMEDDFNEFNRQLHDAVRDNDQEAAYKVLQLMRQIALDKLNNKEVVRYSDGNFNGTLLKKEVYFNHQFKYNVPLYDSIGLISGLASYNFRLDSSQNNLPVVHPIEFFSISNTMIDWLIVTNLSSSRKKDMTSDLLKATTTAIKTINSCAAKPIIKEKADSFVGLADGILQDVHTFLKQQEQIDLSSQPNSLSGFKLEALTNVNLSSFLNPENGIQPGAFYDNRNDLKAFNLLSDMKIVREIKTLSSAPFQSRLFLGSYVNSNPNPETIRADWRAGTVVGSKNNQLILNNATINFNQNMVVDVQIPYTRLLRINTYDHPVSGMHGCGHDGNNDCYQLHRVVRSTTSETIVDPNWRKIVSDEIVKKGATVDSVIPSFNSMSFESFLNLLANNYFRSKKLEFSGRIKQHFSDLQFSKFDGLGTALMVLSKLNQVVKSNLPLSSGIDFDDKIDKLAYVIDYSEEIFIKEDVENLIDSISTTDFETSGNDIYKEIMRRSTLPEADLDQENSDFYYRISPTAFSLKLNPQSFADLVVIVLNQKIRNTGINCVQKSSDLTDLDSEPFLRQVLDKIDWYQNPN